MPLLLGLISLLCGLLAWGLPVLILVKHKKLESKKRIIYSLMSVIACAVSLFAHILHANYEINRSDWSALGDWAGAVHLPSVLLIITIALNMIAVILNVRDNQNNQ